MTTKINASTAGLTETVDTSGILEFQTANTSAVIIDTSQNANFVSTGAITVSVGTTAQRPTGVNGMIRYNSTTSAFEYYANGTWATANVTPPPVVSVAPVISGSATVGQNLTSTTGTWSNSPTGYYYQWRANSTAISANATSNIFSITSTQLGANITCNVTAYNLAGNSTPSTSNALGPVVNTYPIDVLVIGGGGAGAGGIGGGAGGGGFVSSTANVSPSVTYTITVGAGGTPGANEAIDGTNGGNSSVGSLVVALGGGAGGHYNTNGYVGGSGGGGGRSATGAAGTSGQGSAGGNGDASGGAAVGGGGGGASATGQNGVANSYGGSGGAGSSSSITGSSVAYSGGGGGGIYVSAGSPGAGGNGGGGAGNGNSGSTSLNGFAGSVNTGGGGGGGSGNNGLGGAGGSGIVILSILTTKYTGTYTGSPTITTNGSYTVLKFTSSGSYTA